MLSVLRAFTYTRITMRLVMAMNVLQVVVSFPLVFGVGSQPGLGLMGLGYGLLITRCVVLLLLLGIWARRLNIHLRLRDIVMVARGPLAAIVHIGLPSASEKIAFRIYFLATVAMAGSMGAVALATHAYAMQVANIVSIAMVAFGYGAEIIIGHCVGAGDLRGANAVLLKTLRWTVVPTLITAFLAWLIAPKIVATVAHRPELTALLSAILLLEMVSCLGRTFNVVILGGLRATGDASFPVKVSVLINVIMGAGVAWLCGIHLKFGLPGIWCGYIADECTRGVVMALRWHYLRWTEKARASRRSILMRRRAAFSA